MHIKFLNTSNSTINIALDSQLFSIVPKDVVEVSVNDESAKISFSISKESFLKFHKNSFICYEFQLLSIYTITSVNSNISIDLDAIKIGGDNWEYYSFVTLSSNTAKIQLLSLDIPDLENIREDVLYNERQRGEKNKNSKRTDLVIEVIVNTLLFSVPIMGIAYFITKNHLNLSTIMIILFIILLVIFLLTLSTSLVFEKLSKKYKGKKNKKNESVLYNNPDYMFEEKYIKRIIFDLKRYKNKL